jgi:hypothetical protein
MPATKARRPTAAKKPAAARKRRAAPPTSKKTTSPIAGPVELSEEVFKSVESGQRAAIEAVRKFVDTVDHTLPGHEVAPSKRQEVVDAAMEMAEKLVHTQYDFLRKVVDSAGKSLKR